MLSLSIFSSSEVSVIKVSYSCQPLVPVTNLLDFFFFKPWCTTASLHVLKLIRYSGASMTAPVTIMVCLWMGLNIWGVYDRPGVNMKWFWTTDPGRHVPAISYCAAYLLSVLKALLQRFQSISFSRYWHHSGINWFSPMLCFLRSSCSWNNWRWSMPTLSDSTATTDMTEWILCVQKPVRNY